MTDRIKRLKDGRRDDGFTLIELLVVITILGILAAVVVFSVGGINNKGSDSACKADYTTLQSAQEAYFTQTGDYGTMDQLAGAARAGKPTVKVLSQPSKLYSYSGTLPGPSYDITPVTPAPAGFSAPCPTNP